MIRQRRRGVPRTDKQKDEMFVSHNPKVQKFVNARRRSRECFRCMAAMANGKCAFCDDYSPKMWKED